MYSYNYIFWCNVFHRSRFITLISFSLKCFIFLESVVQFISHHWFVSLFLHLGHCLLSNIYCLILFRVVRVCFEKDHSCIKGPQLHSTRERSLMPFVKVLSTFAAFNCFSFSQYDGYICLSDTMCKNINNWYKSAEYCDRCTRCGFLKKTLCK